MSYYIEALENFQQKMFQIILQIVLLLYQK